MSSVLRSNYTVADENLTHQSMALNPGPLSPDSDLSAKRLEIAALLNKLSLRQRPIDSTMPPNPQLPSKPLPGNLANSHDHFPQLDGPIELEGRRKRLGGDVCLVFVHAGAGYHSVQNERTHLAACEESVSPVAAQSGYDRCPRDLNHI